MIRVQSEIRLHREINLAMKIQERRGVLEYGLFREAAFFKLFKLLFVLIT